MATEVFKKGVWTVYDSLEDPELRRLASSLPRTVLASRADSTTRKYVYGFMKWKVWVESKKEVQVFPAQDPQFAVYLQHLREATGSKATVEEAVNAVSWAHQLAGMAPISAATFVLSTMIGLQRQLAKPKHKKERNTVEMLSAMVKSSLDSLTDIRLCAIHGSSGFNFAAFLHCDELIKLQCCDREFKPDSMHIHLPSSKTNQCIEGAFVVVARTESPTYPKLY